MIDLRIWFKYLIVYMKTRKTLEHVKAIYLENTDGNKRIEKNAKNSQQLL